MLKVKIGDSVKFIGGEKHRSEIKDWATLTGLKTGEIYIISKYAKEDGFVRIDNMKFWHHPSRFELVPKKDTKDKGKQTPKKEKDND